MNILLTTINVSYIHPNLAIRILYHLNKDFQGLVYREFFIKNNLQQTANYCATFDIVALSCYIWNIEKTLELITKIKKQNPDCKILLGGPEVSYEWQNLFQNKNIDYIIRGEGEMAFAAFLRHYPNAAKVPSLIWRQNNQVIVNEEVSKTEMQVLSGLNPYKNDPIEELRNKILYIESSRGCPFRCSFCLAGLDNKLRFLPIETVKSNLLFVMQHGRIIKFLDRTFNAKIKYTIQIFEFILAHYQPGNIFQFEIKADVLHPEIVDYILKNVPKGLFRFEVGIQTISDRANAASQRRQDFDKIKSIIQQLSNIIEFHLDLIVGLPHDYWDEIRYSLDQVFKFHASEIQLGFLKFLKGTANRETATEHQYVYDKNAPYQIRESKYLSNNELARLHLIEHVLGIYWNKHRTPRSMKYIATKMSVFDFMLALGEYAADKINFHKYTLNQIFDVFWNFINAQFPDDQILAQLLSIDYYMLHKVRPGIRYCTEIVKKEKFRLLEEQNHNHHKFRFVVLPISFDYHKYSFDNVLINDSQLLIIQYTGTEYPVIVS